ncbi:MAG: hypothetical protein QME51_00415 [Planctomycetota bacterium]|nr:hypothetical protein [Planctomycetota bacterium]MDI6786823.1 hypothetical protein [Planctomycetota bacterium]
MEFPVGQKQGKKPIYFPLASFQIFTAKTFRFVYPAAFGEPRPEGRDAGRAQGKLRVRREDNIIYSLRPLRRSLPRCRAGR